MGREEAGRHPAAAAAAHVLDRRGEDAEVGGEQVDYVCRSRGQGAEEAQARVGLGSDREQNYVECRRP